MIMRRDEHRLPRAAAVRSFASALVCVDSLNFLIFSNSLTEEKVKEKWLWNVM